MAALSLPARTTAFGSLLRRIGACAALAVMLAACGDSEQREIKEIKDQVQRATGQHDFPHVLELSKKGLALTEKTAGEKSPDALYFAQGISEAYRSMRNARAAIPALRREISMRAAAGQKEKKLQPRRTLLIQLSEENGDPMTAAEQAIAVSRGIEMGPGKDPQPVYQVQTEYPIAAFQQKTEGDVDIGFSIDASGRVTEAHVLKSTPTQAFEQPALESFRKWRFTPMLDARGQPVSASNLQFTMAFRLGGQR